MVITTFAAPNNPKRARISSRSPTLFMVRAVSTSPAVDAATMTAIITQVEIAVLKSSTYPEYQTVDCERLLAPQAVRFCEF